MTALMCGGTPAKFVLLQRHIAARETATCNVNMMNRRWYISIMALARGRHAIAPYPKAVWAGCTFVRYLRILFTLYMPLKRRHTGIPAAPTPPAMRY